MRWLLVATLVLVELLGPATLHAATDPTPPTPAPFSLHMPLVGQSFPAQPAYSCPAASSARFGFVPTLPPTNDRPAALHGDLNLRLRGAETRTAYLGLLDYDGDTDPDAPQLPALFNDWRTPQFTAVRTVRDWDWSCGENGCPGELLMHPEVTLLTMATTPGEPIYIPARNAEIYTGGFKALVLYAEERRITLKYTREDNVVWGYTVHLEGVCVDPNLLLLYRVLDEWGRWSLPALRDNEVLGVAAGDGLTVAVRDTGSFMDPRSRKDWWQGR